MATTATWSASCSTGGSLLERRVGVGARGAWRRGDGAYTAVEVSYETSRGLSVIVGGHAVVDGLALTDWFPRPRWSWRRRALRGGERGALAARAGPAHRPLLRGGNLRCR